MPKRNAEHAARLEIRLDPGFKQALADTAAHDGEPLSDWIRAQLNEKTFSRLAKPYWRGGRGLAFRIETDPPTDEFGDPVAPETAELLAERADARIGLRRWLRRYGKRLTKAEEAAVKRALIHFDRNSPG